jgi:hypothetical protein
MQMRLAFLDLTDPPTNPIPTNPPSTLQVDEAARMGALEILARLIADMLAAQEARETPNE